jgi:hypothetical protein
MSSRKGAFELPYLFGGMSDKRMPDAQCNVSHGPCCSVCQGGFTDGENCVDVPDGSCAEGWDAGITLAGAGLGAALTIWAT